MILISISNL